MAVGFSEEEVVIWRWPVAIPDMRGCVRVCADVRRCTPVMIYYVAHLAAMSLGAADFAASMGMQTTGIGGTQENYYMQHGENRHFSDPWHWAQAAIVAACRTHGILPVDGPFGDFSDDEGFRAQAKRSATLGMVGKWAIHPKQIALANEVFTPSDEAVTEAREILAAMEDAKARGEGATVFKGRLVDIASIKQAEVIVRQSEMIAGS